ncbi:MAG: sigma-54-dependent Fis family transcriptional regulator [Opitutae bacterium]|nr:sigma-54-dependent Fis family transcriptional regulator [Opitutae bacterium]
MSPARMLIVEDDADHGRSLREAVGDLGYDAELAATGKAGVEAFRARGADVVLTDLVLPDIDGIEVMKTIRGLDGGRTPVILMTAYGSVDSSVRAMKEGAYDYLQKPLDVDDLQAKLARALEAAHLRRQVERLSEEVRGKWSVRAWVAASPAMREVVRQTLALAKTNATVLIRGESGTGKELVARALHAEGPRAEGPFVAVNCAAFTESLLESELFGHEKGAFTGAVARHAGAFERAQGGTLFLDEIGDAPPSVQVKLLRVLEDREIMRVGGHESFQVDVRLVSATNRDLDARVASGAFRQDLLYRLQVVGLALPPLRERREDIRPLAERFLAQAQSENGKCIREVEPEWQARLAAYAWPGNIRELRNTVEAAVVTAPDDVLRADRLRLDGPAAKAQPAAGGWCVPDGMTLEQMEKKILEDSLRKNGGNRSLTAEQLGLSRRTIQRKIQDFQLPF